MSTRRSTAQHTPRTLPRRRLIGLTAGALVASTLPDVAAAQEGASETSPLIVPQEASEGLGPAIQPVAVVSPGAGSRYFAEAGHNLAEPFRSRYMPHRIVSTFLGNRTQVFTHEGSPENERRTAWREPVVIP